MNFIANIFASSNGPLLILFLAIWVLPWKGIALWKAAQNGHKYWFIAILVINTFALLDIYYIFFRSGLNSQIQEEPASTEGGESDTK